MDHNSVENCIARFYRGEDISEQAENLAGLAGDPDAEFDFVPNPTPDELAEYCADRELDEPKTLDEVERLRADYLYEHRDGGVRVRSVEVKGRNSQSIWIATEVVDWGYVTGATVHPRSELLAHYEERGGTFS